MTHTLPCREKNHIGVPFYTGDFVFPFYNVKHQKQWSDQTVTVNVQNDQFKNIQYNPPLENISLTSALQTTLLRNYNHCHI
jgi:hypothetical protein